MIILMKLRHTKSQSALPQLPPLPPLSRLKSVRSSLSLYTQRENDNVLQSLPPPKPVLVQESPTILIKQADHQIHYLQALLQRLVPRDDKHTFILGATRIDLISDNTVYKIPCQDLESPCKLKFEGLSKLYVTVFVSLTDAKPSQRRFDFKAVNPTVMAVWAEQRVFTMPYIYICFQSD